MLKMFLLLLFFAFGCSATKTVSEASIKIDGPSFQVQYVFSTSEVRLIWRYELIGLSTIPTVKLYASQLDNEGDDVLILVLISNRNPIYYDSRYKGRITGSRNWSSATMILKNLTSDDYTKYKITVEHTHVQNAEKSFISLQAGVKPAKPIITCAEARGNISSITVKEGDNLECSCTSNGLPLPNVVWELPGNNGSVLKEENISRNEANLYTCVASNQYGFLNRSVLHVKVQYPPSPPQVASSSESSYIGQMVIFKCAGSGNPEPFYSWKTPDNRTLTGNNTLVVLLRDSRQFDVYTCITSNLVGFASRNITLKQLLVPGKLRISFTAETRKISVMWRKLNDNGGLNITRYFVRVSKGTHVIADNVTGAMQYEIDELTRNTTYKFCIKAENMVGVGKETCKDISTLSEGVPDIPAKPRLTVGYGTLVVKWNKVFGNPDYYYVQYKTQNEDEWVRSGDLGTKKLVYEILNVAPGKIYNVRIGAGNEHGKITGKIAEGKVPFRRTTTDGTSPSRKITPSTDEPALGETTDEIPTSMIAISVVLVLLIIVVVIFLVFWLKRRSTANDGNEPDIEHMEGPLGDLYAVVEGKTKKDDKSKRKDLVYAELSDFDCTVNRSRPPTQHHTEYADIAHVITGTDNDYEDIPPRSDGTEFASISLNRQNSISV